MSPYLLRIAGARYMTGTLTTLRHIVAFYAHYGSHGRNA